MEKQNYLKQFIRYCAWNIFGMIGLSCYILSDTFFISKGLGANGLTALNLAIPVYSFIHGIGLMLGMGGATRYSILRGQKDSHNTDKVFMNTIYTAVILAVIFVLTGAFFSNQVTLLLGADREVFSMTKVYLQILLLFAPAILLNDILLCFVRNDGNPRLSMFAMLTGSISNIILDYIFIFLLKAGIFGAVLSTVLAPMISVIVLFIHFIKRKNHFHFGKLAFQPSIVRSTIMLGFPSLITEVSSGLVMIVFNIIILGLQGNVGVAAYGVIANLSLVAMAIFTGIAQGMQPLVSRAFGKNDQMGIKMLYRYAVITMLVVSCVVYGVVFVFANPIASVFNSEKNALLQEIATYGLKLYFASVVFMGFNIILSTFFTSTDRAIPAQVISLLRGFLLIVPLTFLLAALLGVTGVWLSFPVTEGIVALVGWFLKLVADKSKNTPHVLD